MCDIELTEEERQRIENLLIGSNGSDNKEENEGILQMANPSLPVWASCHRGQEKFNIFFAKVKKVVRECEAFTEAEREFLLRPKGVREENEKPTAGKVVVSVTNYTQKEKYSLFCKFKNSNLGVKEFCSREGIKVEDLRPVVYKYSDTLWSERFEKAEVVDKTPYFEDLFKSMPKDISLSAFCKEQGIQYPTFKKFLEKNHPEFLAQYERHYGFEKKNDSSKTDVLCQMAYEVKVKNPERFMKGILEEIGLDYTVFYKWVKKTGKDLPNAKNTKYGKMYEEWNANGRKESVSALCKKYKTDYNLFKKFAAENGLDIARNTTENDEKNSSREALYQEFCISGVPSVSKFLKSKDINYPCFMQWLKKAHPSWRKDLEKRISEKSAEVEVAEEKTKNNAIEVEKTTMDLAEIKSVKQLNVIKECLKTKKTFVVCDTFVHDALRVFKELETLKKGLKDLLK